MWCEVCGVRCEGGNERREGSESESETKYISLLKQPQHVPDMATQGSTQVNFHSRISDIPQPSSLHTTDTARGRSGRATTPPNDHLPQHRETGVNKFVVTTPSDEAPPTTHYLHCSLLPLPSLPLFLHHLLLLFLPSSRCRHELLPWLVCCKYYETNTSSATNT